MIELTRRKKFEIGFSYPKKLKIYKKIKHIVFQKSIEEKSSKSVSLIKKNDKSIKR